MILNTETMVSTPEDHRDLIEKIADQIIEENLEAFQELAK